jgi:hypothetical protein
MPACRQCGKENPEGTVFCGYCATPLAPPRPAEPKPAPESSPSIQKHEIRRQAPPKVFKPESRVRPAPASPAQPGRGGGGFELLPWNELSGGQKAGRVVAGVVVLFLFFFLLRGFLHGGGATNRSASAPQGSTDSMSDGDRKDGIESLCKVFQIYGIPKTDLDAAAAAKNAGELFKLAGNESPERSEFILTTIAGEFRSRKLTADDCAQAGAPLPTSGIAEAPPDGGGDRIGGIPPPPPPNSPNSAATR